MLCLAACGPSMEGADTGGQTGSAGSGETGVVATTGGVDETGGGTTGGGSWEDWNSTGMTGVSIDTGVEPETGVVETTVDLPDPPTGDFTCMDARWVFVDEKPTYVRQLNPDLRGHVLVYNEHGLLDLDPQGSVAVDRSFADVSPLWSVAGPDAAGNWFLSFAEDNEVRRRWLRKFDVEGQLVWELDLGAVPELLTGDPMDVVVAPNGGLVLTDPEDQQLHRFAADGTKLWSVQPANYLRIQAMNDAGEIVGLSPGDNPGPHVLEPDGSLRWKFIWESADNMHGRADINAAGEVVAGSTWVGVQIKRFSPAGEIVWQRDYSGMPGRINYLGELAINDAGDIVLGGRTLDDSGVIISRVAPDGELLGSKLCNPGSFLTDITIDNAGVVYAGGYIDETTYFPFVAVFD